MDDSGHWYRRDGSPCYEVMRRDGSGMRGVDLRWDRDLELVPSVTTVLRVWPKAQLDRWLKRQVAQAALSADAGPPEGFGSWREYFSTCDAQMINAQVIDPIIQLSQERVEEAARIGTVIHDACERAYKRKRVPKSHRATVAAVQAEVARLFPSVTDWVSEASFAHDSGFGGKVDLHSPSTGHVVDFKGKDGDLALAGRLAYDQVNQLAAYQHGLELRHAPCANVFFSRTHPGSVASHKWGQEKVAEGWRNFQAALAFWKVVKKYDPSFTRMEIAA